MCSAAASSSELPIALEQFDHVDEIHASHRVAADANAGALPQTVVRRLKYGLIGEGAGARHDPHAAALVNEARHDADLAFLRGDDAGAVRSDQPRGRSG